MAFLNRILEPPRYGFEREGILYKPLKKEIWSEFFYRLNIIRTKKNWLPLFGWVTTLAFIIPLVIFITKYWSWKLALVGLTYSMVVLGSFGTFWFHRYSTHRAFKFKNSFFRDVCRHLAIKVVPDEIYVISHHVHHAFTEMAGDPYNAYCGWLYCFLADVNHQLIKRNLSEADYGALCKLMDHTGVRLNSYKQYQKWGSLCHPAWTIFIYVFNWSLWYGIFYLLGGNALATAIFGFAGIWAFGIRTFNFDGHGRGKDRRKMGVDFDRENISVNQIWPGFVAGEWHNNHHLYPNSARSGFLKYQLDLPWLLILTLHKVRMISSFRDSKGEFFEKYYSPYLLLPAARPVLPMDV
jgi:fatty-acid desaturase